MSTTEKKKVGRKPFAPTEEQRYTVSLMAGIGIVHDEIAKCVGISDETLRKYFREELDTGKVKTIARVADSLVRQALAGNITAAIYYLKTQGGWRETGDASKPQGKKEAAQEAAKTAGKGSGWGDDLMVSLN